MKAVVVGGGVSGVSLAYLLNKHSNYSVMLIEKNKVIGGKASTIKDDGYCIETGPNGFLDNKEEIKKLISESGFEDEVIGSKDEARRRFIFSGGGLYELPENPLKLLTSGFISIKGLLNVAKEPFKKPYFKDETLKSFVVRRLGKEMLDKLIGPMACGVYAGNPEHMSMDATFSRIKEIERQYGSLIKGLIELMKQKKANTASTSGPFSAKLMSFRNGVGSFIKHLSDGLNIINDEVVSLEKKQDRYVLYLRNGYVETDLVVFAIPSYSLSSVVEKYEPELSKILISIDYAPLSVVSLGFDKDRLPDIVNSFGYLFDLNDIQDVIGVLFDSSIFDFRAENDKLLVRLMVGGAIKQESAYKNNVYSLAIRELQRSAGILKPFEYSHSARHKKAIPQYGMNHKVIVKRVKDFEQCNKGIFITGNAFYGVSLNDCVKSSYETVDKIL